MPVDPQTLERLHAERWLRSEERIALERLAAHDPSARHRLEQIMAVAQHHTHSHTHSHTHLHIHPSASGNNPSGPMGGGPGPPPPTSSMPSITPISQPSVSSNSAEALMQLQAAAAGAPRPPGLTLPTVNANAMDPRVLAAMEATRLNQLASLGLGPGPGADPLMAERMILVDDWSPLAKFYYADESLNAVAAELDSFDGRRDPDRCNRLVNKLRHCHDRVLQIIEELLNSIFPTESDRSPRDYRVKFPDDILHENLPGQLWFGAEAILCRYKPEEKKEIALTLTKDQSPQIFEERIRIEKAGDLSSACYIPSSVRCDLVVKRVLSGACCVHVVLPFHTYGHNLTLDGL